ncbi:MAG: choice-of-anchor E domain-containing protein [Desertimonas sp.]
MAAASMVSLVALAAAPASVGAQATQTVTYTAGDTNFELDSFTTEIPRFDPALGTLLEVQYTINADVNAQLCVENISTASGQANAEGGFDVDLEVTVPGLPSVTAATSVETGGPVEVGNGRENSACDAGFDMTTFTFPTPVSGSNLVFDESAVPETSTGSLTTGLDGFIGTTPLTVSYGGSSAGSGAIGSEWVTIFTSFGNMSVDITYVYAPPVTPTTTTTLPPTTTAPEVTTTTTPAPATTTTVAVAGVVETSTTVARQLPRTGSDTGRVVTLAAAFVLAGAASVLLARRRMQHR